jgi:hypothetical protein
MGKGRSKKAIGKRFRQALREHLKNSKPLIHWGDWIHERSQFVGFRRHQDLANAIGCHLTQLFRWFNAETPPDRMHKGFDEALARTLRVSSQMLFTQWRMNPPNQAPIVDLPGSNAEMEKRRRIALQLPFVEGEELELMSQIANRAAGEAERKITASLISQKKLPE